MIEDSLPEIDVVRFIIGLFSEALREEEDKVITAGTGTGQPTGLTTCTITNVTCSGNLDFDDIINLIYALPAKYRRNATFLVNNVNIREMRKIKDGNSRYIWNDPVAPAQPATVYGYPVIENNWLPESKTNKFRSLKIFSNQFGKVQRWITHSKQTIVVQLQRLSEKTLDLSDAIVRTLAII